MDSSILLSQYYGMNEEELNHLDKNSGFYKYCKNDVLELSRVATGRVSRT